VRAEKVIKLVLIGLFAMTMATFTLAASTVPPPGEQPVMVAELG
jgi:hypothetical protein